MPLNPARGIPRILFTAVAAALVTLAASPAPAHHDHPRYATPKHGDRHHAPRHRHPGYRHGHGHRYRSWYDHRDWRYAWRDVRHHTRLHRWEAWERHLVYHDRYWGRHCGFRHTPHRHLRVGGRIVIHFGD